MTEYDDTSGWNESPAEGSYNPQMGIRATFKDEGKVETSLYWTQDGLKLDTSIPYLVSEAPFQVLRKFEPMDDGGFRPCFERRDPKVRLEVQRETLGDTDEAAWPVSKFTRQKMDPWVLVDIMYLLEPRTLKTYTLQGHTVGFSIAIRELKNMVQRRHKQIPPRLGELPLIKLEVVPFQTRYNLRSRPNFNLVGYGRDPFAPVDPSMQIGGPSGPKLIEGSVATPTNGGDAAPIEKFAGTTTVPAQEPTLAEDIEDELPF